MNRICNHALLKETQNSTIRYVADRDQVHLVRCSRQSLEGGEASIRWLKLLCGTLQVKVLPGKACWQPEPSVEWCWGNPDWEAYTGGL